MLLLLLRVLLLLLGEEARVARAITRYFGERGVVVGSERRVLLRDKDAARSVFTFPFSLRRHVPAPVTEQLPSCRTVMSGQRCSQT